MERNLKVLIGVFLLLVLSGIAYAASDKDAAAAANDTQPSKNMTYGQCVSENAVLKNTCYANVKTALNDCKAQAAQDASKKDATKQCKQTYKKDKKQCKAAFKAAKNECKKIKHNFMETLGSAFK